MKQQTSKTSRRGLLKAALSLGVAHAANNPFISVSTSSGMYQLIGTRGTALDLGTLSLLQVP